MQGKERAGGAGDLVEEGKGRAEPAIWSRKGKGIRFPYRHDKELQDGGSGIGPTEIRCAGEIWVPSQNGDSSRVPVGDMFLTWASMFNYGSSSRDYGGSSRDSAGVAFTEPFYRAVASNIV